MFWLSMINRASELDAIAPKSRLLTIAKGVWKFSNSYGEYQAKPPSERRRFILERECCQEAKSISEPCA